MGRLGTAGQGHREGEGEVWTDALGVDLNMSLKF